jgi:hypothetical protein
LPRPSFVRAASTTFNEPNRAKIVFSVGVEIKGGFELPDGTKLLYDPALGGNKFFEVDLPRGLNTTMPSFVSLNMPPVPFGKYCYRTVLEDSVLATNVSSARACFSVVP